MITILTYEATKEQICRFLTSYHCLTEETQLKNDNEIVEYIRKVGCIQYDPLDVVGKNPDLVLQARCSSYKKGDIEALLYRDKVLFDVWDKNMSIASIEDWKYFTKYRARYLPWCEEHYEAIGKITQYLEQHEFVCSSDFDMEERVPWHYGPQRLAKAALEGMCYAGLAIVHHKKGARRYYCLAEKSIPSDIFMAEDPNIDKADYYKWTVLRRINSIGVLWNKASDAWLGIHGLKSEERNQAFKSLILENKIVRIDVKDMKYPLYIDEENLESLIMSVTKVPNYETHILAPLDNLLWDRKLIKELFGFDYKWEVYTPALLRRFGYYVLPVLFGEKFIGRIELITDKKESKLIVKAYWGEENSNLPFILEKDLEKCLEKFTQYNLCNKLAFLCNIV